MRTWEVFDVVGNEKWGVGTYRGAGPQDALEAFLRDAGFAGAKPTHIREVGGFAEFKVRFPRERETKVYAVREEEE